MMKPQEPSPARSSAVGIRFVHGIVAAPQSFWRVHVAPLSIIRNDRRNLMVPPEYLRRILNIQFDAAIGPMFACLAGRGWGRRWLKGFLNPFNRLRFVCKRAAF